MRALAASLLLLVGTAHADEPPAWLRPDAVPAADLRERAFVARKTKITLAPQLPPAGAVDPVDEPLVVIEAPERGPLRLLYEDRMVRLGYYVDRAALAPVAREGAVILATTDELEVGAKAPGVRLRAGTRVTVDGRGGVTYRDRDNGVEARGQAAEGAFGRTFVPGASPPHVDGERVTVLGAAQLLDAPRGRPLARLRDPLRATRLESRNGHTLVDIDLDPAVLVGWVRDRKISTSRGGARHRTVSVGRVGIPGLPRSKGWIDVEAGDLLYAAPDGPPIGVVLAKSQLLPLPAWPAGWAKLEVPTQLGTLGLYKRR
jgi:hypothetical protein